MSREDYKSETIDYEELGLAPSSGSKWHAPGAGTGTQTSEGALSVPLPDSPLLTPIPYEKGELY